MASSNSPIFWLFDGITVAFSGTNRERRSRAVSSLIGGVVGEALLFAGVASVGYQPQGVGKNMAANLVNAFYQGAGMILGLIFLIIGAIGVLFSVITLLCLAGGSSRALKKEKADPNYLSSQKVGLLKRQEITAKIPLVLSWVNLAVILILGLVLFI
jgi:hypothetical protein